MKKIAFSVMVILAITGCSKTFLERGSLTDIGDANFWKTQNDAILGINGIYDVLQDRAMYSGNLNGDAGLPMYDNFGDNAYNSYKFEGPGNFMVGNIDPSASLFEGLWTSCYKGIARANEALEKIPQIPSTGIADTTRQALMAQALFLRALFYMNIAVYYQDAPLILQVQALKDAYVPSNSFQDLSAQIVNDLTTAAKSLPVSYPPNEAGYATKGAALGLLARFDLYLKDYQGVVDATSQVMSLGYSLEPNYGKLFTEAGESSPEIIFSVKFYQDVSNNGELFSGTYAGIPKVDEQPMPNLVNDYYCTDGLPIGQSTLYNPASPKANRDPRLAASVYFKGDTFLIDINRAFKGNTATKYGLKKYIRNSASSTGIATYSPGGQDFIVLRYADILLMRAEALVELNQTSEVPALVDQVRARVNMPSVESVEGSGLSQDALRQIVRHERRVELAFEGLRFFDLKRWGTVNDAFQAATSDKIPGYSPDYRNGKSEIFAIPQSELDANSNLVQNPAWQ